MDGVSHIWVRIAHSEAVVQEWIRLGHGVFGDGGGRDGLRGCEVLVGDLDGGSLFDFDFDFL